MANVDRPAGARPVRYLGGAPYNGAATAYNVDSSNGTAIFVGDFMIREADGNVAPYTGTGGGSLLGVCIAAGTNAQTYSTPDTPSQRYLAASTAGTVLIADDPHVVFEIQEDNVDGTALAATDAGTNCDVLATAGSTTTGQSAHEIDRSTVNTTTAQLRLIRLVPREDNAYGDFAKWEVIINEQLYRSTTGT